MTCRHPLERRRLVLSLPPFELCDDCGVSWAPAGRAKLAPVAEPHADAAAFCEGDAGRDDEVGEQQPGGGVVEHGGVCGDRRDHGGAD